MTKLAGILPRRHDPLSAVLPTTPYRHNARNFTRNLEPRGKLTKQGVKDLNGPRADGTGYNGNKTASCAHHKAPDMTPIHVTERMARVTEDDAKKLDMRVGELRRAYFTCCSLCGDELYENARE